MVKKVNNIFIIVNNGKYRKKRKEIVNGKLW